MGCSCILYMLQDNPFVMSLGITEHDITLRKGGLKDGQYPATITSKDIASLYLLIYCSPCVAHHFILTVLGRNVKRQKFEGIYGLGIYIIN